MSLFIGDGLIKIDVGKSLLITGSTPLSADSRTQTRSMFGKDTKPVRIGRRLNMKVCLEVGRTLNLL